MAQNPLSWGIRASINTVSPLYSALISFAPPTKHILPISLALTCRPPALANMFRFLAAFGQEPPYLLLMPSSSQPHAIETPLQPPQSIEEQNLCSRKHIVLALEGAAIALSQTRASVRWFDGAQTML